ncbi:hypothetical protein GCM10009854_31500 [Saccharopolyspora halophila]|uniref:histidine kinase n=1 Tax=Saccharopolyspora halophila TaxID=405551 RepID=A0ABN3GH16_9PSEU
MSSQPPERDEAAQALARLVPALRELRDGNFRRRLVASGPAAEAAEVFNELAERNGRLLAELDRLGSAVARGEWQVEPIDLGPAHQGRWGDVADAINDVGAGISAQLREIADVARTVAAGDLNRQITVEAYGEMGELKDTINGMVDRLSAFAGEISRVSREVAREGRLGSQAEVPGAEGVWRGLVDSVNYMADNLTVQLRSIAQVATAVARGNLTQKIDVDARGEIFELKSTINTMVDQLSAFASEVTRVAREVGTEGKLGGQARVHGVAGTWQDLTDNVNIMADNLTGQVRNIAEVTKAVARGDLSKKIDVDARGEILELKSTINTMVDQLSAFASEVTRVAKEVGTEGKLGGQAEVADVSGTWRRLTESVNSLAGNLTTQVRAIAQVATAVTDGDLSQQITVDASGEVAELKDNVNAMIGNLRETTRANRDQDWLKTNLARLSALMKGQRDLVELAQLIMSEVAPLVSAHAGAFFLARTTDEGKTVLEHAAGYGRVVDEQEPLRFRLGESLVGQAAADRRTVVVQEAPPDYVRIGSGLGSASPKQLVLLPVLFEGEVLGVIELATIESFGPVHLDLLERLRETIGIEANTIIVNSRTEALLTESQHLTSELQARSDQLQEQRSELQRSNAELEDKAALLASRNRDIENKNLEIEQARQELEDRARQLSLASAYKSEFLANMSHELRTPLNSILILAKLLADNMGGNLTEEQADLARTVHQAGSDLLQLINDVLDLSKVEAGQMRLLSEEVEVGELAGQLEQLYRPQAADKGLEFNVVVSASLPPSLRTDRNRLEQVLRNLLSNAIKFTDTGVVELRIRPAQPTEVQLPELRGARQRVVFTVRDTGIGIAADKLDHIFEAFQQADGTTVRKYGGTGLGLSISREFSELLGGELQVRSEPGQGSSFSLYLASEPGPSGETEGESGTGSGEVEQPPLPRAPTEAESSMDVAVEGIDPPPSATEPKAPPERPRLSGTARFNGEKVLVVDDDERGLRAMRTLLEQHGLQVVHAGNAVDGLQALREHGDILVVLMDVMMPSLDGNETIRLIREMPRYRDLAIIAVTAKAMQIDRERSLAAGATAHLTKPVDADRLFELLSEHLPAGLATEG